MKSVNKKTTLEVLLIGILPVCLIWFMVLIVLLNNTSIEILTRSRTFPYGVYTDQELHGNSVASAKQTANEGLIFSYMLQEGYDYPYAGISFAPQSGMFSFDLTSNFIVELTVQTDGVIPLIINEFSTSIAGKKVERPLQYELKTQSGTHSYTIPLQKFVVPSWWYKTTGFRERDFPGFDPSHIENICIQNSSLAAIGKEERIEIKEIRNAADAGLWIWGAVCISVLWIISYGVYLLLKKKTSAVFIPYVSTVTEEQSTDEWAKIRDYISINYMNDIDMERIEKELGIARHKIALLIKENTTLIFKQYLNQIKVAEAKRLLLETDLPVGEIADQVGFGHLSNFNRVFKQYTGESPSDLRKQSNN